jgi:ppGpp synthetase/RelA/SpoT-type nucleotidyltranferase
MSAWAELRDGIRYVIPMQDRVERLSAGAERMAGQLVDHDRRLVRIETMIELAQNKRLPDDSMR